jgi:hypothetical protein
VPYVEQVAIEGERSRSPGRGERLFISNPRDPRLRVQRLVRWRFFFSVATRGDSRTDAYFEQTVL